MSSFETNPKDIKTLLTLIHSGELALPDFQRDFVWDPAAIEELLESIMKRYPAGSLLFLKDSGEKFQVREFENAPKLHSQQAPSQLALDGQQRMTSLYQAFYGHGTHRFYVDFKVLIDKVDIEGAIFNESLRNVEKRKLTSIKIQSDGLIFPLSRLMNSGFHDWLDEVMATISEANEEKSRLRSELRKTYDSYVAPMLEYKFPVVTLEKSTPLDAVCSIFETLNRRGVKLDVFELLMARSFSSKVSLRSLWSEAISQHTIIKDFDINPYYILQTISLITGNSIKRQDILNLDPKLIELNWASVVEAFSAVLKKLSVEEGVLSERLLPYNTMLVPFAAVLTKTGNMKGIEAANRDLKLRKWFWASVFSSSYEMGPTSRAVSDYRDLLKWIGGDEVQIYALKKLYLTVNQLKEVTPKQKATYKGVLALFMSKGSRDFHNASLLDQRYFKENRIDDHHIFPKNYLKGKASEQIVNCVLNRTFIDSTTNNTISDKAPKDYLTLIEKGLGSSKLVTILDSHSIPMKNLKLDRFDEFIDERGRMVIELLAQKIEQVIPETPQIFETEVDEVVEDYESKKEQQDPTLINRIPYDLIEGYPSIIRPIFEDMFAQIMALDSSIWSKINKDSVSFYSPDRNFVRVSFRKSGLSLLLFIGSKNLPHVKPVNVGLEGGGQLFGRTMIRSIEDISKVMPSIVESLVLMNESIAAGAHTGWWKGKRSA